MTNTTPEFILGEFKGQLAIILHDIAEGAESRRRIHEKMDQLSADISEIGRDVKEQDKRLAAMEPDVLDYRAKRQQVIGARMLGRFLWALGGIILAIAAWLVGALGWLWPPPPHP
jgi:chromosome segregation ATPase